MSPSTIDPAPGNVIRGVGLSLIGFAMFSLHDALIKSIDGVPVFQIVFFVVLFSFVPFALYLAIDGTERSLRPQLPVLVGLRCLFTLYPMLSNVAVTGIVTMFVYVPIPGDVLLRLCAIGILSVIGQFLMIQAYRTSQAQFVAPMQYSQMLWALIYGALVFNETVDRTVLLGSAVIVCSGLLFIWRELAASVKKPVLSTRNLRQAGGPATLPAEADKSEQRPGPDSP